MSAEHEQTPGPVPGSDSRVGPGSPLHVECNAGPLAMAGTHNGDNYFSSAPEDPWSDDVSLLSGETDANLRLMARSLALPDAGEGATIERSLFPPLVRSEGDLLLTGEPGTGKTGLMYQLARHHRERGHTVVLLEAVRFADEVADKLAGTLHSVLTRWEGEEPGYLLIDAVDGDRGDALGWLADTVELLRDTRWRTVVSARRFDIAHNRRWREAFRGAPTVTESAHQAAELHGVRHFLVGDFTPRELDRAGGLVPSLDRVLTGADAELRALLSNPFHLFLACELLTSGHWPEASSAGLDRSSLLGRYWNAYVTDRNGRARNRLLGDLCRTMLDRHRLQIGGEDLLPEHDGALRDLCANGVLRQLPPRYADAEPALSFTHHIFFDYAVSQRIFVKDGESALVERLDQQPNLVFAARPSIDLHLAQTWGVDAARESFADLCWGLSRSGHVLAGIAAALVAVDRARSEQDVDWLVSALAAGDESAEDVVSWVIGALRSLEERDADVRRVVSVWTCVATALAQCAGAAFRPRTVDLMHRLLRRLHDFDALRPGAVRARERADCVACLMSCALEDVEQHGAIMITASQDLPAAIAVDRRHARLLRRILHDQDTQTRPYVFRWLVRGAADIARTAPELATELLEAVWVPKGVGRDVASMSAGVGYQVGQVFADVVPLIGVEAACRVLAAATTGPDVAEVVSRGRYPLHFQGEEGYAAYVLGSLRHTGGHGAPEQMLDALLDWAERAGTDGVTITVRHLVRRVRHPAVWTRVMERAQGGIQIWHAVSVELLSSGALLASALTRRTAANLLKTLSAHADDAGHERLERAVLIAAEISSEHRGRPDHRTLDELVSFLDGARLTRRPLIDRRRIVERMEAPPEVSFGGIVSGSRALTPQERFGTQPCEEVGEEGLALLTRMDELADGASRDTDGREELGRLFLETVHTPVLSGRITPGSEDAMAAVIVRAAGTLARFETTTPRSELGRHVYQVLLRAIGEEAEGREEGGRRPGEDGEAE